MHQAWSMCCVYLHDQVQLKETLQKIIKIFAKPLQYLMH